MPRTPGLLTFCLAALIGAVATADSARAELPRALFTVDAVPVDVTNPLPIRAREIAIANAQSAAYQRLIRRFVPEPEASRMPAPSASELERLAAAIEVVDEKKAGARYVARITVVFRPDDMRRRLKAAGLPFSLTRGRPAVIIAGIDGTADHGPLRRAVEGLARDAWLQPGIAPVSATDGEFASALAGDASTIAALARKAGSTSAVVVRVLPDPGGAASGLTVNLQMYRLSGEGGASTVGGVQNFRMSPEPLDGADGIWARTAAMVMDRVNEPWKRDTAQDMSVQANVDARASFSTLADWLAIQDALTNTQAVVKMDVLELSNTSAAIGLTVTGTADKLAFALAQRDVRLQTDGPAWRLTHMTGRSQ